MGVFKQTIDAEKPSDTKHIKKLKNSLGLIIAAFAFLLYAQSILNDYALDDKTVTNENYIVTKGIKGIPELLKTDYWHGYIDKSFVPEYRPASLIMFAVEWQFFPNNPHISHLVNVLLYSISCWLLFLVMYKLFNVESKGILFPFVCCLLFVAHPIHTEVVDNIKSRDEILCFLFGILSILYVIKYIFSKSNFALILSLLFYFLSLLSKETGITFLFIIPLMLYVFTHTSFKKLIQVSLLLLSVSLVYFLIRAQVLSGNKMNVSNTYLENSLIAAPDFLSRQATAFYILIRYIWLLLFPYSLSCDYSFSEIKIHNLNDPISILSIVIICGMGVYAFLKIPSKGIIASGILFFLITLAPVSNIFLIIASTMAERFLYIPSLGFCMIVSYLMIKFINRKNSNVTYIKLFQFFIQNKILFIALVVVIGLYSTKIFSRNMDWKDNKTLFLHDVNVSDNSAILHFRCGKVIAQDENNSTTNDPIKEYDKGLNILGTYKSNGVYNDKGCALLYLKRYDEAVVAFQKEIEYFPKSPKAYYNLAICFKLKHDYEKEINTYHLLNQIKKGLDTANINKIGMAYFNWGNQLNLNKQNEKAVSIFDSAINYIPNYSYLYTAKAAALFFQNKNYEEAIELCTKAIQLDAKNVQAYIGKGYGYSNLKQYDKAIEFLNKSIALDSINPQPYYFIGIAYQNKGNAAKAKEYLDKANKISGGQQ